MNKHGLYSKAAEIIRSLPQEKGTVDQYIAAAKARGAKPSELEHAGRPEGDKITREEMANHFEGNLPKMYVSQYGENPSYMPPGSGKRFMDLQVRSFKSDNPLSPEEERELSQMRMRHNAAPNVITEPNYDNEEEEGDPSDTNYGGYTIPGGRNYRERLLTLGTDKDKSKYHSSHWTDHENVLAHIRMSDRLVGEDRDAVRPIAERLSQALGVGIRDLASGAVSVGLQRGVIKPEEAASLSRVMGWRNGYDQGRGIGKRLLHVEELQSDWGQEGRDKGFHDPENPYEVVNRYTKEVVSQHPDYQSMWDAYRTAPNSNDLDIITAKNEKPPAAPYVTNTQHWTDLALKNVLREAALGNYEGVVFSPGQAQADRYGLEKHLDTLRYQPSTGLLVGTKQNAPVIKKEGVKPEELHGLIGRDMTDRLLHPDNAMDTGAGGVIHKLQGDDLKMGGEGMKGYYDNIVPKSVMRLAQQHDPSVKPSEPVQIGDYQGFHLPMTDTLKNSILDKGFSAFKRGGAVDVGKALAVTRSFTKDGRAAMMRLKD